MLSVKEAMARLQEAVETFRDSETFKHYLRQQSKFTKYSPRNVDLIFMQKSDATYVKGFKSWMSLGRQVRKGEKAIGILAPIPYDKPKADGSRDKGVFFKVTPIFDVTQTDPIPGKEETCFDPEKVLGWKAKGETDLYDTIKAAALGDGVARVHESDPIGGAMGAYTPSTQSIRIVKTNTAEMASVLIHEWAHYRTYDGNKTYTYAQDEVIVESIAYIVSQALGVQHEQETSSFVYITNWLKDDKATFTKALTVIQKNAHTMIEAIKAVGLDAPPEDAE